VTDTDENGRDQYQLRCSAIFSIGTGMVSRQFVPALPHGRRNRHDSFFFLILTAVSPPVWLFIFKDSGLESPADHASCGLNEKETEARWNGLCLKPLLPRIRHHCACYRAWRSFRVVQCYNRLITAWDVLTPLVSPSCDRLSGAVARAI
jgi:hypothetical protein